MRTLLSKVQDWATLDDECAITKNMALLSYTKHLTHLLLLMLDFLGGSVVLLLSFLTPSPQAKDKMQG